MFENESLCLFCCSNLQVILDADKKIGGKLIEKSTYEWRTGMERLGRDSPDTFKAMMIIIPGPSTLTIF